MQPDAISYLTKEQLRQAEAIGPEDVRYWILRIRETGNVETGHDYNSLQQAGYDRNTIATVAGVAFNVLAYGKDYGEEGFIDRYMNPYSIDYFAAKMRERDIGMYNPKHIEYWLNQFDRIVRYEGNPYRLIEHVILDPEERDQVMKSMEQAALMQGRDLSKYEKSEPVVIVGDELQAPDLPAIHEVSLMPYKEFLARIPSDPQAWIEWHRDSKNRVSKTLTPGTNIEGRHMFLHYSEGVEQFIKCDSLVYSGTIGDAYTALTDTELKPIFVKITETEGNAGRNGREFTKEVDILTRAKQTGASRHFPQIIGSGKQSFRLVDSTGRLEYSYIVMEPVIGQTLPLVLPRLREYMTDLESELVITGWMHQYLDVMDAARDIGVSMQDRKTNDIVLQRDGNIVVLDWNTQEEYDPFTGPSKSAMFLGHLWIESLGSNISDRRVMEWGDGVSIATRYFAEKMWLSGVGIGQIYINDSRIRQDLSRVAM